MHALVFETLADPTRRSILESLRAGERSVNEIVATVEIQQSGVSRHLRILQQNGFVRVRPDAQRRLYSLRPERFDELAAWAAAYRALWEGRLDRFAEALERRNDDPPQKSDPPSDPEGASR